MASKFFIDANVVLDFTLKRDNYAVAKQLFEWIVTGKIQAFISPSIVHIVGYWLTKSYGNVKAKSLLLTLLADVTVIDAPHETVVSALHSRMTDIEDSLQYYTALHHKLDGFISSDKLLKKMAIASLPVYTIDEILRG
jgi:predicted nucleic acid-binding protein